MTRDLRPSDDPAALHDKDKCIDDIDAEPDVPADLDDDVDDDYLGEGEPGDRTDTASSRS